jgi:hypothetical protein
VAHDAATPACQQSRQLVPTSKAARDIYVAIVHARHATIRSSSRIDVRDEGSRWAVFQLPRHLPPPRIDRKTGNTIVTVATGSDQLQLSIDKCDAAAVETYSR